MTRLIRVSFGPFQLAELEEGAVEEVRTRVLREQLGERLIAAAGADFSAPVTVREDPEEERPPATRRGERPRVTSWSKKPAAAPANERPKSPRRGDRPRVASWSEKPATGATNERPKPKRRSKGAEHAWRGRDEAQPVKKLHRKFRGGRGDESRAKPAGQMRAELLTDRKGRRVPVERYGEPPARDPSRDALAKHGRSGKGGGGRSGGRPNKHAGERAPKHSGRRRAPDRAGGARPRNPRGG